MHDRGIATSHEDDGIGEVPRKNKVAAYRWLIEIDGESKTTSDAQIKLEINFRFDLR